MSAAEASEALRSYPVRTFLDWLDRERIGIGGARERGVHFGALLAFEGATVNEEQARQWASRFGRDIEDIWGDGAIREDALEAGPTVPGSAASQVRTSPQTTSVSVAGVPGVARLTSLDLAASDDMGVHIASVRELSGQQDISQETAKLLRGDDAKAPASKHHKLAACSRCGRDDFDRASQRNSHLVGCKGPKPAPKVRAVPEPTNELEKCPLCPERFDPARGLRNHIRNAHHRDPDDFLGVPAYRAAAQKVSVPGDEPPTTPLKGFPVVGGLSLGHEPPQAAPPPASANFLRQALTLIEGQLAENMVELEHLQARAKELGDITECLIVARDALEALDERTDP